MAIAAASPTERPARPLEPPFGALGVAFAGLFVAGLLVSTIRAGGSPFPSPFGNSGAALDYFREHPSAVRSGAVLQYAAAIPLALYAAAAVTRLRRYGDDFGAALTALGGALTTVFLLGSGVVSWVLTVPEVTADPGTVRAMHILAFLLGGPANVMAQGLFIAGLAIAAQSRNMFGPSLFRIGLGIALIAMLTTVSLTFTTAAFLLPIARFTGMAWLIASSFRLPRA